jgi:peptide/nickel transport system substrate-binding protein
MTPDFRVVPGLASRWEFLGNNTYRFTLRKGVAFHDGSTLDARAVKYTIDQGITEKTQYSFLSPQSVRIVDDTTVEIRPSIPNARLLEQLTHPTYGIIATGSDPATRPVCTGAFRFAEYAPQNRLSVVRNDSYWGERAKLGRVTFRFIPDDNTRVLALRAGDVDVIFDVNRSLVAGLKQAGGLNIETAAPGSVLLMYLGANGKLTSRRMSDLSMRRVVAMAIDRRALVDEILEGQAVMAGTVNPAAVLGPYAGKIYGIPYKSGEAARLLDSLGWRPGKDGIRVRRGERLTLSMISQPGSVDRAVTQYIQAQLKNVGIEVTVDELDPAAFESRLNSGYLDLDIEVPSQNDANPAFLLALRWYSRSNVRSAQFMWHNVRFDSLVAASLASQDHGDSQRYAAEAMHILVDEEAGAIPLAGLYRIYALRSRVKGFEPHPSRINQSWSAIWIAR